MILNSTFCTLTHTKIFISQNLQEKETEWVRKNETLRRDLRHAIRSSIHDTEREVESIDNLEQVPHFFASVSALYSFLQKYPITNMVTQQSYSMNF